MFRLIISIFFYLQSLVDEQVIVKADTKKDEDLPKASILRIMKLNAPEWQIIVVGVIASAINGGSMPAYAILFGEVLGVRPETSFLSTLNTVIYFTDSPEFVNIFFRPCPLLTMIRPEKKA